MTSAAPAAAPDVKKSRRFTTDALAMTYLFSSGGKRLGGLRLAGLRGRAMDGFADALVGSAAADIAAHEVVDVGVGRFGLLREQRDGGHDLSGLAVTALRDVFLDPGLLHGMAPVGRQAFDGRHLFPGDARYRGDTRAGGFSVEVHGPRSAQRHAAAELRAGHVQGIAKHPQQRHFRANVDGLWLAVQSEADSHGGLLEGRTISYNNSRVSENGRKVVRRVVNRPSGWANGGCACRVPGNSMRAPRFAGLPSRRRASLPAAR